MSSPSDSKNIPTNKKPYKNLHTSPYKLQASDIYNPNDSPLINKPASKHNGMRLHLRSHSYGYSNDKKDFAGGGIPAPNYAHNNTPNWKTLIPPMPSYPQPSYKTDKRLYSPSQLQKKSFQSQPNTQIPIHVQQAPLHGNPPHPQPHARVPQSKPQSEGDHHLSKPNQRHSIAVSPSSEKSNFMGNESPSPALNQLHQFHNAPQLPPPRIQNQRSKTQVPQAPTQEIPPFQRQMSSSIPNLSRESLDQTDIQSRPSQIRQKSMHKKKKFCKGCGLEITGQFVRALSSAFHIECFRCNDCGNQCSSKFFPYEMLDEPTGIKYQVALCEYDYFKKLNLICFNCNNALRGPYITALGNKYHLEHFKCAVCQVVFESDESYYEHEGDIFCHYHYSKLYATHCEGCHSSIVKQFVELFRGGRNQQWHPECYMVHKFWNVCILADSVGLRQHFNINDSNVSNITNFLNESNLKPELLIAIEQHVENTIMNCWLTLSGYEETTAACISDMLLNACTSNQSAGLIATGKLILNVEVLFNALDVVQDLCSVVNSNVTSKSTSPNTSTSTKNTASSEDLAFLEMDIFQPLRKEPRNISGKIMSYLAILRKSMQTTLSGSLSTELLAVVTGCAHYLKLLIRIGLNNALKVNKLQGTTDATDKFLSLMKIYEEFNSSGDNKVNRELIKSRLSIPTNATDSCQTCVKSIEKSCIKLDNRRWHTKCFICYNCSKPIAPVRATISQLAYNISNSQVYCTECYNRNDKTFILGFELVTDLSQLVYLLKIALYRSKSVMKVENKSVSQVRQASLKLKNMSIIDEESAARNATADDYSKTLNDVTRLRASRQSQKLSNSIKQNARKSVILEAPEADKAKRDETNAEGMVDDFEGSNEDIINKPNETERKASISSQLSYIQQPENDQFNISSRRSKKSLRIKDEPQKQTTNNNLDRTSDLLQNEKSLTLDDIPRIVAAEQAREQRPNAFKHHNSLYQKHAPMESVRTIPAASTSNASNRNRTSSKSNNNVDNTGNDVPAADYEISSQRLKYYSELDKSEHFILRHIAVEALIQILNYNKDELLGLIQTRKLPTFWDKFKFGGTSDPKKDKHLNVFGVDIQDLTKRYGVDSDLGVGPSKLRIPIVVDEIINALRQKDMSVEGIFRLNGNIKKLRELTDQINKNPLKSADFSSQTAVQLAALMKKWLRELPNPLLTFNLYDLWISSQQQKDPSLCKRILQLAYCMLPRSHRNLLEVLLYFFSWVASFAEIDEETGSKMDIHNLATVISPNILISKKASQSDQSPPQSGDNYFLGIEVVNQLIELHEELCIIPDDLLLFFEKCKFNENKSENISTKEIMNKLEKTSKEAPNFFLSFETKNNNYNTSAQPNVQTNKISRGHSKVTNESHGETSDVQHP